MDRCVFVRLFILVDIVVYLLSYFYVKQKSEMFV